MSDLEAEGQKPVVPLPPELSECACPWRPDRHLHTCQTAIAYDNMPLSQRPEYALGRRFRGVTFQLPNRMRGTLNIDVEVDIEGIVKADRDRYVSFEPDGEWEEWEKPLAFVWDTITEAWSGVYFGGRRLSFDYSDFECKLGRDLNWTREDTERLQAWLDSPASDPNQPELPL